VRASGCVASSVWAISRPLPSKHFLKEWDFSRGVVTQDGDHFLFADFIVVVAAFIDGLDDRFELFLRDHGLFFFWVWMGPRRSGNGATFLLFEEFFVELFLYLRGPDGQPIDLTHHPPAENGEVAHAR
jgi:hypothetical protein